MNIQIDPELQKLIPPLRTEEKEQLEKNILENGLRDPLVVWNGTIIDGHNRHEICQKHGIEFKTVEMEFPTREAVEDWMDANQLGRRNLSPDAFRLLIGRRYNRTKKAVGGQIPGSRVAQNEPPIPTADKLAAEHGISPATVKRAGQLAEAAEALEISSEISSGQIKAQPKAIIEAAKALPENPTQEDREEARKNVHVSNNSGQNEWYTPPEIIESARKVMGSIDLDPASCEIANERVMANKFYSIEESGLEKDWEGNVWMNPPYAQPLIQQFADKIASEYDAGNVWQGIVLVNNATETKWFQSMAQTASAICLPLGRVKFLDPKGNPGAPLQGQVILYFGVRWQDFVSEFTQYGKCYANG